MKIAVPEGRQALAEACAKSMYARDHTAQNLGIQIESVGPGTSVLTMVVDQRMVNGLAICHGGMMFTLADTAFAYACNAYNIATVAQHCSITFLRPGKLGQTLRATAQEVTRVGRNGLYDIRITALPASEGGVAEVLAEFRGQSRALKGPVLLEGEGG